jgi:hypothetical protein
MADRWVTYQQAGDLLGLSAEAARKRARRQRWRTQPGNDGRMLVLVPEQPDEPAHGRADGRPDRRTNTLLPPQLGEVEALRELAGTLQSQLAKAEATAERERADHMATRERLEGELRVAREVWEARLDGLAVDLADERRARLAEAEAHARREMELQQIQAEIERLRSRPWWRKLIG